MEWLVEPGWRIWPALGLVAAGCLLWLRAFRRWRERERNPGSNLEWMLAFRQTLLGAGVAGVGVAWAGQWPLLFWAAFVIGFEETLESSIAVAALKRERELEAKSGSAHGVRG